MLGGGGREERGRGGRRGGGEGRGEGRGGLYGRCVCVVCVCACKDGQRFVKNTCTTFTNYSAALIFHLTKFNNHMTLIYHCIVITLTNFQLTHIQTYGVQKILKSENTVYTYVPESTLMSG